MKFIGLIVMSICGLMAILAAVIGAIMAVPGLVIASIGKLCLDAAVIMMEYGLSLVK